MHENIKDSSLKKSLEEQGPLRKLCHEINILASKINFHRFIRLTFPLTRVSSMMVVKILAHMILSSLFNFLKHR